MIWNYTKQCNKNCIPVCGAVEEWSMEFCRTLFLNTYRRTHYNEEEKSAIFFKKRTYKISIFQKNAFKHVAIVWACIIHSTECN